MLACVVHALLGNAEIDLVDLYVDEAGEGLRSGVTSWSGETCTASIDSALVCPGGSVGWCGCFCTAPCRTYQSKAQVVALGELVTKRSFAMVYGFERGVPSRRNRSGPLFSDWKR